MTITELIALLDQYKNVCDDSGTPDMEVVAEGDACLYSIGGVYVNDSVLVIYPESIDYKTGVELGETHI